MTEKKKIWFRIRKMGWTPCSWQGWLVLVVYFVLMMFALDIKEPAARRLCGAVLTAGVIGIAMWKTKSRSTPHE